MNRFSFRVRFPVYFRFEKCSAKIAVQTKLMSGSRVLSLVTMEDRENMELLCISKSKLKKLKLYHILSSPIIQGRCDDLFSFIWRSISETGHICKTAAYLKTFPTSQASPSGSVAVLGKFCYLNPNVR